MRSARPAIFAAALAFVVFLGLALPQTAALTGLREQLIDAMLRWSARAEKSDLPVVMVDIDTASLAAHGPWPWRRETLAELIRAVAAGGPRVIGLDIALDGPDMRSSAALARQLDTLTKGRARVPDGTALIDGDAALAEAIDGNSVVLGWLLTPEAGASPAGVPVLARAPADLAQIWRGPGAIVAPANVSRAADGSGTLSLPGDADGVVRRVPLLLEAGGRVVPGFAAELVRLAQGASSYIISPGPQRLGIGEIGLPLAADGMLRLVPATGPLVAAIPAGDVLRSGPHPALKGAIVIIGGSAPELGGLRPSLFDPLTPSLRIHAEAARQIATGVAPAPPSKPLLWSAAAALAGVGGSVAIAALASPLAATAGAVLLLAGLAAAFVVAAGSGVLVDPLPAFAATAIAFITLELMRFAATVLREAQLRRRFQQHLAPEVVDRIVADAGGGRLKGERRTVTALFTDIEGFSDWSMRAEPEALIGVLDGYFEGLSGIVIAHGGMIDKFVGDAVHAFFNMPLDLPDHAGRAIDCATKIIAWSEDFRSRNPGLGRTRIGIETGPAIVGDVGLSMKLDYTAHGAAVNTAARLEALNKQTGTSILIGPVAAASSGRQLRPAGEFDVRGIGRLALFTVD